MANEQREFWSAVAQKYDQVVDLQIGPMTRSMVRERVAKEGRLGKLAEMRRILKPGGKLIISNLDPGALDGVDRVRCLIHILYHGLTDYRVKPPTGLGKNIVTEKQLCDLLGKSGLEVASTETIKDTSRTSNIPVEYIRAVKL